MYFIFKNLSSQPISSTLTAKLVTKKSTNEMADWRKYQNKIHSSSLEIKIVVVFLRNHLSDDRVFQWLADKTIRFLYAKAKFWSKFDNDYKAVFYIQLLLLYILYIVYCLCLDNQQSTVVTIANDIADFKKNIYTAWFPCDFKTWCPQWMHRFAKNTAFSLLFSMWNFFNTHTISFFGQALTGNWLQ